MSVRTNKRKDFNEIAFAVGQIATGEAQPVQKTEAQINGSKGGAIGGAKRAKILTAAQRTEIARNAARSRWKAK